MPRQTLQVPTYYLEPQQTIQSPDISYEAPMYYIQSPDGIYKAPNIIFNKDA